ncbi:MAG: hypothetical protein LC749_06010 [Actinobacteria bacterium]|nr:hypothetical protein [Actinomycetota bacterium]
MGTGKTMFLEALAHTAVAAGHRVARFSLETLGVRADPDGTPSWTPCSWLTRSSDPYERDEQPDWELVFELSRRMLAAVTTHPPRTCRSLPIGPPLGRVAERTPIVARI